VKSVSIRDLVAEIRRRIRAVDEDAGLGVMLELDGLKYVCTDRSRDLWIEVPYDALDTVVGGRRED